uniref:Uncharacterized protein n=1 Tax=Oryza glumipatula TaxID=40148 RepID=A0A1Y8Z4Q9_9ORYZ
MMHVEKH